MTHAGPPAIVLGMSPTGLYAVRELARAGVPVTGIGARYEPGLASACLSQRFAVADTDAALRLLLDRPGPPGAVLIPTSDDYIELVGRNAPTLAERYRLQDSYRSGVWRKTLDKFAFYGECERMGVAYPRLTTAGPGGTAAAAAGLSFPLIVKPSEIHKAKRLMAGRKVWVARDADDLRRLDRTLDPGVGTLLLQEMIPGPESEILLWAGCIDREGAVRQPFVARKLRQYPPGFGSASLVQSRRDDAVAEASERLLRGLDYKGIAAVEWKRDPRDGRLVAIEVNARPSLWFGLATAAGRQVTLAAYRDLTGGTALAEQPQKDGLRWRYSLKDSWSAAFYRRTPGFVLPAPDLGAAGPPAARVHAVYDRRDPRPALAELRMMARKGARRLFGKT